MCVCFSFSNGENAKKIIIMEHIVINNLVLAPTLSTDIHGLSVIVDLVL